ncbi:hypothetical protein [Mumia sp. DW29H23]|uniref:hypothetical protein n=1 Tax=Mumia sp. DW29H23 TaxID=3421241 RepID=UPI003D69CA73
MGNETVVLDGVGRLSRSGRTYHDAAEDGVGAARSHLARMEGVQAGFTGAAGATFQAVAQTVGANHAGLARQIAEQARRVVSAERAALAGDDQARSAQAATRASAEALTGVLARPVNV